jgi:hypothetical protein
MTAARFRQSRWIFLGLGLEMACSAGAPADNDIGSGMVGSGGSGGSIVPATGGTSASGGSASGSGGTGAIIDPGSGGTSSGGPCTDGSWACKIVDCAAEGLPMTTVRGTVYDPAGRLPLYNVAVYVPNTALSPITDGAACETCATPVSGQPVASALTDASGEFVMENVPAGTDVPLVIQIGKWRREVTLPEVRRCEETVLADPELLRLPRNQSEGHIPKIAMTTGEADSLECLLRRLGVDAAEFTPPEGTGRINLFSDPCTASECDDAVSSYASSSGSVPSAYTSLWDSAASLMKYDMVFMSCTGSQSAGRDKTTANKQALKDYLDGGGRAFIEHYHYAWLRGGTEAEEIEYARKYPPTPFPVVATWATPEDPDIAEELGATDPVDYSVDTSFPKGDAFARWLVNVGASGTRGTISLLDVKHPALAVDPDLARQWIYTDTTPVAGVGAVPFFSVNTPIELAARPEEQCGRFVHTGIHIAVAAGDDVAPFDSGCTVAELTPQEKAMAFLIFDLSSCVMDTKVPPVPPVVVR